MINKQFYLFRIFVTIGLIILTVNSCSKENDEPETAPKNWYYLPDKGFQNYLKAIGAVSDIRDDSVCITDEGLKIDTLNFNRIGYTAVTIEDINVEIGGVTIKNGFCSIPNMISDDNLSNVDTTLWTPIKDLTGIEYFTDLKCLYLNGNDIISMDLSKNKELEKLTAENNLFTSITFDNPELKYINLVNNLFESLDISKCAKQMNVFMVTGYSSLNNGGVISDDKQDVAGVLIINGLFYVQGSININGSFIFSKDNNKPLIINQPTMHDLQKFILRQPSDFLHPSK